MLDDIIGPSTKSASCAQRPCKRSNDHVHRCSVNVLLLGDTTSRTSKDTE